MAIRVNGLPCDICGGNSKHLENYTYGKADAPVKRKRKIVCLCGSTRFAEAYRNANRDETLKGHIVLSVGLMGHGEGIEMSGPVKAMLDELHLDKIDLATEILVLNALGAACGGCGRFTMTSWCPECNIVVDVQPYIGESTRREIAHAVKTGKPIRYLNLLEGA